MDTKQAIGSTVKNQPTGLDGEEIPAPETERLAFDRELARQTAQLTVPLSSVGSLQNSLPAIQAIPMDSNLSPVVKWCKDVLALVNRISASNVPPKDDSRTMSLDPFTGPVKISDHALSRLVDVAVTSILRISSIAESGTISVSPVAVAEAFFLRATLEASGAFPQLINHDPRKSFRDFENAVLSGYHEAWFNLGRAYEAVEDIERAKDCFQNGTNFDVESCLYRMGMAHLLGQLGLPSSSTVAIPLLHRAALLATVDVPQPAYVYGLLLRKEFSQIEVPISAFAPLIPPTSTPTLEARKHIERAAFLNFAPAQYKLGHAYQFAEPPFPFEPMLSVHYYSLASQQGKSEADMALSNWLLCGAEGCFEKDEALAYTFAEKAARKGMASAEYAIGYYHESGVGCVKDVTTAMVWYRKSAANGNTDAGERLHALLKLSPRTLSRREREAINETAFTRKGTETQQSNVQVYLPPEGDEENRQSLPHDKTLLEYSTPWSQAVVTNTSAAHIEQRTRFSPSSPSGNLDLRGSQNRHFHAEHDPAAAPRSSAPPLKGGPSQQSFPVYIERQEVIRKKGGIFRFLPSLKPQEVSQLHGSVSGEEDGPSSAPAASTEPPSRPNGVTQLALTIQQPIVIPPTPTSAQSNPLSFFKLFSKRNRRVSIASLEACDGDAGGNGGGSTRSSISSSSFGSNGRPLPPFRDPNEAMRAWISDVESTVYHRNGRRRRPGVTFDVAYDEIPTKERRQTRDWRTVN
ncbi:HCP-like protein [Rickenella mellea]|uniref:HCP-like protein n=1 Tax=Rickenella mellea TaxID=50990 RepID=A0A4Y7PLA0_9AGAM|nr:HCP-like protein [Rickenella mellea]